MLEGIMRPARSAILARMSAFGQKQTYAVQKGMSALPPKADMSDNFGMSAKRL